MRKTNINHAANDDGTRNVSFLTDDGWTPAGRLQPALENHVPEQPKALAEKILAERTRTDFIVNTIGECVDVRG